MLHDLWRKIQLILRELRGSRPYTLRVVADMPNKFMTNVLYLERRGNKDRWLHFLCPSGCGEIISVNLMKSIYPYWTIRTDGRQNVTLTPSINKIDGCRSHFFLHESRIEWALPG